MENVFEMLFLSAYIVCILHTCERKREDAFRPAEVRTKRDVIVILVPWHVLVMTIKIFSLSNCSPNSPTICFVA